MFACSVEGAETCILNALLCLVFIVLNVPPFVFFEVFRSSYSGKKIKIDMFKTHCS